MRNTSNTLFNSYFSTHSLWLVKIYMGPTKLIWDPHDLVRPMWILTNQKKCVEKCVLEGVLLAFLNLIFLFNYLPLIVISHLTLKNFPPLVCLNWNSNCWLLCFPKLQLSNRKCVMHVLIWLLFNLTFVIPHVK